VILKALLASGFAEATRQVTGAVLSEYLATREG